MPMYTCKCDGCGKTQVIFRHIASRDHELPECHGRMHRIVEAAAIQTDLPGYQSPIDGRWVEGRVARSEDLKRNNCRPWEGMESERKEAVKRAEAADAEFGKKIESGIADVYNGMSAESQRALAQL
ncbi:hypothetical protein PIN31115_02080 [Pandoraea iniqua]|uniref:Uncharacterized protein n=1 Tax=Pandoraea iniqua TaxID=2508288 RepID=A0A5E4UKK6_9BURK|nr:zinc ribbon domain-containing protein [Pandoraea iniqua]VVE00528.1 hypothetical protein PIN31115_02080 [Pandoraea iniqua]